MRMMTVRAGHATHVATTRIARADGMTMMIDRAGGMTTTTMMHRDDRVEARPTMAW
jgi:hypothetical protein